MRIFFNDLMNQSLNNLDFMFKDINDYIVHSQTKKQSVNVLSAEEIDRIVSDALNSNQNSNENKSNDYVPKSTFDDLRVRVVMVVML